MLKKIQLVVFATILFTFVNAQEKSDSLLYKKDIEKDVSSTLLEKIKSHQLNDHLNYRINLDPESENYEFEYVKIYDNKGGVYLFSETEPMIYLNSDRYFIGLDSNSNLFVTDKCKELLEVSHCYNISKIDKNGNPIKLTDNLSSYIFLINMGANSFVAENNKRYILVLNTITKNHNLIDESGKLYFDKDKESIVHIYGSYILTDDKILNIVTKKKINYDKGIINVTAFRRHQMVSFSNIENHKRIIFDIKNNRIAFEPEELITEIDQNNGIVKKYFESGSNKKYRIVNLKGELVSNDYYSRFYILDDGTFGVRDEADKVNNYNPYTKKYLNEVFYDDFGFTSDYHYIKQNGFYQLKDLNNNLLYSFEDKLTSLPSTHGNMIYFRKMDGKKIDIYSKDMKLLYKDAENIRDVNDSNGFFIIIRDVTSKNHIVDKDGNVLIPNLDINGYLRYNYSTKYFEMSKKRDGKPYLIFDKKGNEVKK